MQKPRWFAAFNVAQDISKKFRDWMEGIHFGDIEETECFTETIRRIFEPGTLPAKEEGDPVFDSVLYLHEPKSEEDWKKYKEKFRPKLKEEFVKEWGWALKEGLIKGVLGMGDLEEI